VTNSCTDRIRILGLSTLDLEESPGGLILVTKIALLGAVLLAAAIFENLGDAAGYLVKSNVWGQYALAVGAMAVYGILTVTVGRSGWSFTQAFPLGYLFLYFAVGLVLGTVLEGRRPSGFQILAAVFMMAGLVINFVGNLKPVDSTLQNGGISRAATASSPERGE
jgi:drug/metabolite transporter (DMT)-like permease